MAKRYNPIISTYSDQDDTWLKNFQKNLEKGAVQSKKIDESIFEQMNSIMNTKSKYPSVQAAVDDMMNRSGMKDYLEKTKKSENENNTNKKTASSKEMHLIPIVIKKLPRIANTCKNYIESTRGNLPIPAIIDKIKSIHQHDVSDASDWEDENLIRYISKLNLAEKSKHGMEEQNHFNLGKRENMDVTDTDPSNTDAFFALNPVKI